MLQWEINEIDLILKVKLNKNWLFLDLENKILLNINVGIVIVLYRLIVLFQCKRYAAAGHKSGPRLFISSSGTSPVAVASEKNQD